MNDMRKLMEAVENISAVDLLDEYQGQPINEGWDPKAIAQAIHDDVEQGGSALELAAQDSPEPYRAMIYEFGNLTGLYNAETLDGSEIWHKIVDELELLFAGPGYDDDTPLTGEEGAEDYVQEDDDIPPAVKGDASFLNVEPTDNDYSEFIRKSMLKDLQQLEEDTLRVYQDASSEETKQRPDYTEMLLNELRETLTQITDIVSKYD